ncbi:MAG TPA: 2Fe-2S iron-sulfur cluster-binding protein [Hydrogenophaga sp.]|uniref:2Fe-2S iron-sulfur cluster-binding protein n=1 Tax=Hydrogenophaga sp. TaxID=1904254 RepID=UPI002BC75280|nr:2Fe-2S iron-sulfur cluster-binding protein [Hydrogenophaga sp.]HMN91946.1 2Fe-2S iron-sulfur cluster-binding protein [Hydrogenophaga sp.]HMP08748.1 2Fe-2S iron-sulfur cluster-binding protein [Hydrogenophaga sp.]
MSRESFDFDGQPVPLQAGDTILQAARRAGHEVPHLCWHESVSGSASCRLCTVLADGRPVAACVTPAVAGQRVECHTDALKTRRLHLLQMLFVEGNHFCPGCEKSGSCQLQHQAERAGMTDLHYEALNPDRPVDASHPDVWFEPNRCILCQLCVRASDELDGKRVFAIGGHGIGAKLLIDSESGRLGDSRLAVEDRAAHICPVGALLPKRVGFAQPYGERTFDDAETRG